MKNALAFVLLLASALSRPAQAANNFVLPQPVPGIPVGWCIRAKTNVFADAQSAGFEYVELALPDVLTLADGDFEKLAAELRRLNLPARAGYNPLPKWLMLVGTDVDRPAIDAHLHLLLSRAATLKLDYIVLNSATCWKVPDGFPRDEAFTQLADFSTRFADEAAKSGITVLIEPMRGTDSNMITNINEALKLVTTVGKTNFQMMVDYSFLRIQNDNLNTLLAVGNHLRNVHISNPPKRTYAMSDDESDYAAFFQLLKEINYRGGLSVHGAPVRSVTNDAPLAIAFLRKHAAELVKGQ